MPFNNFYVFIPPCPLFQHQWAAPQHNSSKLGSTFGLHHWSILEGELWQITNFDTSSWGEYDRLKELQFCNFHTPQSLRDSSPVSVEQLSNLYQTLL